MKIKMQNVRLSFPSLFQHSTFGGESTGKYDAQFILDKVEHKELIAQISEAQQKVAADAKVKVSADKMALKDGDESGRPELEGKMTIKASTKKRPLVIDKDKSPLTEEDGVIYAGCYVNAIITLWCQNNSYGRRVNAQLDGVQFAKDGEPFGAGGIDANEFDSLDDDMAF